MVALQASWTDAGFVTWREGDAAPGDGVVWLPCARRRPVPSHPLLGERPSGRIELRPVELPLIALTPAAMIELLCRCGSEPLLEPGVLIGTTLRFWHGLMRFAGNLVARERILPGPAGWEAAPAGRDAARLADLARAMPHACRAVGKEHPSTPAALVARTALNALVHALVAEPQSGTANNPHERWLDVLRGAPTTPEVSALAGAIREWRRPLDLLAASPYRLGFRLDEPLVGERWKLSYLLQSHRDPSLLLEGSGAWASEGRDTLLASLGMAARLSPLVEASLRSNEPAGAETDDQGAFAFLSESAGALEEAGFAVMLPSWWTSRRKRVGVRGKVAAPPMAAEGKLSLKSLLKVDWTVALGDHELTLDELQELARHKTSLVRVRGEWVVLRPGEIEAALAFFKKRKSGQLSLNEVMEIQLGLDPLGIPVEGIEAEGQVAEFLERLTSHEAFSESAPGTGFEGQLRPYQLRGYSWLLFLRRFGLGACLADDMGLGKTIQTLAALWEARREDPRPTLLVCPTSVLGNWQREAQRWVPELPVALHHGAGRGDLPESGLVLTSYSLLHRDAEKLAAADWGAVVLDEAQNIKNANAKQAQAARSLKAGFKLALTGTPVENHVGDLWSLMEFLQPGLLGSREAFKRNFFVPIQTGSDPEAAARLKRLTGPFLLRRLKTDRSVISDLPDKLEVKARCRLTREQASLYEAVVADTLREIENSEARSGERADNPEAPSRPGREGMQKRGLVLSLLSRLKQICNHPAHYLADHSPLPGRSGKLERLTELVDEILEAGDRGLIFTQYFEMGELLQRYLQETFGREVMFLHGGLSKKVRDAQVERFQGGEVPLFLLSLKAGGTGITLTAANHVFHYDRWWNPAVEDQATDRAFRIGQKRHVQVHKFLCEGTVEEKIDAMIERKQSVARSIVGTGEGWLTELSTTELRSLFELSREVAVGV